MITITDKAKERIVKLREQEGLTKDAHVRVSVKGGGCSGLMYDLAFDEKEKENDQIFEDKGVKIFVDRKSIFFFYS